MEHSALPWDPSCRAYDLSPHYGSSFSEYGIATSRTDRNCERLEDRLHILYQLKHVCTFDACKMLSTISRPSGQCDLTGATPNMAQERGWPEVLQRLAIERSVLLLALASLHTA